MRLISTGKNLGNRKEDKMEKVEMRETVRDTQKRSIVRTVITSIALLFFFLLLAAAVIRKFCG